MFHYNLTPGLSLKIKTIPSLMKMLNRTQNNKHKFTNKI